MFFFSWTMMSFWEKTWRNLSISSYLTRTFEETSHTTWTLNLKIQFLCLYNSYNKFKVQVVRLFFYKFRLNILILKISPRLFIFINVQATLFSWRSRGNAEGVREAAVGSLKETTFATNIQTVDNSTVLFDDIGKAFANPVFVSLFNYN